MGVTCQAPTSIDRFGEQDPRPFRYRGVYGPGCDQIGELANYSELLVPVERASVRQYLDPDVVALAIDVGHVPIGQCMNESRSVLPEHRDVGNPFYGHQCPRQVDGQLVRVGEGACRRVHIDHRHRVLLPQ